MFWLAFDVLATMFLFVVALLIVVGVIAAVAGIFTGLDNFLSWIFESPREPRPWRLHQKPGPTRVLGRSTTETRLKEFWSL